jgi:hypothetical protein
VQAEAQAAQPPQPANAAPMGAEPGMMMAGGPP